MRIVCDIKGYYEWLPVPEGTEVMDADFKALRAKKMVNGAIAMRVPMKLGDVAPHLREWGCSPNEPDICQNLAVHALLDKDTSRAEWVWAHLKANIQHHLHRSHIVKINVDDDGPLKELYAAELARQGVTGPRAEEALAAYMEPVDLEEYLNRVFNTDYAKGKK